MKPRAIIEYGDYYLTHKIATGGMAELFRARKVGDAGFEKLLVIKRLLSHLAADQELRDMFLDEARLASQLTHQNIAQVYDLGRAQELGVKPNAPQAAQTVPEKPVKSPPASASVVEKQAEPQEQEKPKPSKSYARNQSSPSQAPREAQAGSSSDKTAGAQPAEVEPAVTSRPQAKGPPTLLAQARQAVAGKDYNQALALLVRLEKDQPGAGQEGKSLRAKALVGRAAQELNESPVESLKDLQKAAVLDPDDGQVYFQTGRAQTMLKKYDEAIASYNKAVELDPKLDGALFNRGYLYLTKKRFTEAVQDFQKVVDLDSPYTSDAFVNMGVCYFQLGNRPKAMQMLKIAIKANPDNRLAKKYIEKLESLLAKQGKKTEK